MADEFVLDTPFVRALIATVRERIAGSASAPEACEAIRPIFQEALARREWLPMEFRQDVPDSGMGGGIGQWLLFRSADRSLCLFSLVVPPGSMTPIHDHLAWGLVGLYHGSQDEEFYRPLGGAIELLRRRPLTPGDYYVLLPPADDVHRVRTTSADCASSVSRRRLGCSLGRPRPSRLRANAPVRLSTAVRASRSSCWRRPCRAGSSAPRCRARADPGRG